MFSFSKWSLWVYERKIGRIGISFRDPFCTIVCSTFIVRTHQYHPCRVLISFRVLDEYISKKINSNKYVNQMETMSAKKTQHDKIAKRLVFVPSRFIIFFFFCYVYKRDFGLLFIGKTPAPSGVILLFCEVSFR